MTVDLRSWVRPAVCALAAALFLAAAPAARAQGGGTTNDPRPQWMKDTFTLSNRYLLLWNYFQGANVTKFDLWTNEGDPEINTDDLFFFVDDPTKADFKYVSPWGSRLFSAAHPRFGTGSGQDQNPYANIVTIRVDDQAAAQAGTFKNLEFPADGRAMLSPPIPSLAAGQGFSAPYRMDAETIEVEQKLQFARDLLRVEYIITNVGTTTRRIGTRLLVDAFVDNWGVFNANGHSRSVFLPDTRERIFFEKDFGQKTGAGLPPRDRTIPREWMMFDDDEGPNPIFVAKGILTGNGATTPTRVVFANSLNLYPNEGAWDYSVDRPQELRTSDISTLIYWDPVLLQPGEVISFVTYIGEGVADHAMSDFYQLDSPGNLKPPFGFVSAVQTPFAVPLVGGRADTQRVKASAYMQNTADISIPSGTAFIQLPDGLEFDPTAGDQALQIEYNTIGAVGSPTLADEGKGEWFLRATGLDAGLLPITVLFGNGFGDSARVVRKINVPQGRRYILTEDFRLLTFPFRYQNLRDAPEEVIRDENGDPVPFVALRFNPQSPTPEFPWEQVTRLKAGESYWIRHLLGPNGDGTERQIPIIAQNATAIAMPVGDVFGVSLRRGWNMVGNPSPYTVPVRELTFITATGRVNFDLAVQRNFIRGTLFRYDRKTGRYVALDRDDLIPPGEGIWINSAADRLMLWPAPQGPGISVK